MKFFLSLTFCLCFSYSAFPQSAGFKVTILDREDSTGIPLAHIYMQSKNCGTVSDVNGRAYLSTARLSKTDTIAISAIGYKTRRLLVVELQNLTVGVLFMQKDTVMLKGVVVTNLTAKEIVLRSIKSIEINHKIEFDIPVYHWIAEKTDQQFTSLKYFRSVLEKGDLQLHETELINQKVVADTIGFNKLEYFTDLINFTHVYSNSAFFNLENFELWSFDLIGSERYDNESYYQILAKYKANSDNVAHQMELLINQEDYGIAKLNYSYSWEADHLKRLGGSSLRSALKTVEGKALFSRYGNNYHPTALQTKLTYSIFPLFTSAPLYNFSRYHEFRFGSKLEADLSAIDPDLMRQIEEDLGISY